MRNDWTRAEIRYNGTVAMNWWARLKALVSGRLELSVSVEVDHPCRLADVEATVSLPDNEAEGTGRVLLPGWTPTPKETP